MRAIGNEDCARSMRAQMPRSQFAHLSGANYVYASTLQAAEDFLRELDGYRSDRDYGTSDGGFRAHALRHRKGSAQQGVEIRLDRSHSLADRVGLFYLSENLRLPHDHRVEARSYAKDVTNHIIALVFVQVLAQVGNISQKVVTNEARQIGIALGGHGEFNAIARREHDAF